MALPLTEHSTFTLTFGAELNFMEKVEQGAKVLQTFTFGKEKKPVHNEFDLCELLETIDKQCPVLQGSLKIPSKTVFAPLLLFIPKVSLDPLPQGISANAR